MKNKKIEAIIKLFKSYLITEGQVISDEIDKESLKKGIYISEDCSKNIKNIASELWGKDGFLLNQTFHKSLNTVIEKETEELMLQQCIHYITTYLFEEIGEYKKELVYIPKEKLDIPELKNDIQLIKISPITKKELKEKLKTLCTSSIPLSKKTIQCISELLEYIEITKDNIDIIKNKEIKTMLYDKLNIVPKKPEEFLRYLIFCLTNNTLIIKNKETIDLLKNSDKKKALNLIVKYNEENDIKKLAEIFNRYKPLFLALKTPKSEEKILNSIINKISHLSKKYHKPMKKNELDEFIKWTDEIKNRKDYEKELKRKLNESGIWRIIKLKNYLEYKKLNNTNHVYKIRNGKTWIEEKESTINNSFSKELKILENIIIDKLREKVEGKKIYLDKNIKIKLPQSEKQFVGNIPFGSSLSLKKDNLLFGIHWFNTNKRVDLDLKLISNEYSIGWNDEYKEEDKIVFSGDVTDAPPPLGATECIYVDKSIGSTIMSLKINNYTSNVENIEYDIIISKGYKKQLKENYVINPNDIIMIIPKNKIDIGQSEHSIGTIIIDDKSIELIFTDLSTSNRIVSANSQLENILREYIVQENKCKCDLKDYLQKAKAVITKNKTIADIDLSIDNLNKDSIIELLS